MAAAPLLRAVVAIAIGVHRAVIWVQSHDPTGPFRIPRDLLDRLHDPDEDDNALAIALSDAVGYPVAVTTFAAPFELRQFQFIFDRASESALGDDVCLFTTHHLKLVGGVPNSEWVAADFAAIANGFDAAWTALKPYYATTISWARLKAYKAGPDVPASGNVAVYDNLLTGKAGTSTNPAIPPQCAISVTERAGSKLHWGRLYLPNPARSKTDGTATLTGAGRLPSAFQTVIADAMDGFYEACNSAGVPAVVYRKPLPERENAAGGTLPARAASAWTVETIAVDDVYDVIRSRRWKQPLLRVLRGVGA